MWHKDLAAQVRTEWENLRRPWTRYTAAQTGLNGAIIAVNTGSVMTGAGDALRNLPFIGAVNLFYAKTVDYLVRHTGKHGRLAGNLFSLGVSAAFYAYAHATNDSNPDVPCAIAGVIGLYLTNRQVSDIKGES